MQRVDAMRTKWRNNNDNMNNNNNNINHNYYEVYSPLDSISSTHAAITNGTCEPSRLHHKI